MVFAVNPLCEVLLARRVDERKQYTDLYERRGDPPTWFLAEPQRGVILAWLTEAEMRTQLDGWLIRVPLPGEKPLPVGFLSLEGQAWLGIPEDTQP